MDSHFEVCDDDSDLSELSSKYGLYLKPINRITITVKLPDMKSVGKTITNWEVMEKLKYISRPFFLNNLHTIKTTTQFLRFEADIDSSDQVKSVLQRLEGRAVKLSGIPEGLTVKAAEAKLGFPVRHDWEAFFRDAEKMDQMRPGERPDTVILQQLPTRWFCKSTESEKPDEDVLKIVFERFGQVRTLEVPDEPINEGNDKYSSPGSNFKTFSYNTKLYFDLYVQYVEYQSFVRAMDSLRGKKLLYKRSEGKEMLTCVFMVDFDRFKHMTDENIHKRRRERRKARRKDSHLSSAQGESENRKIVKPPCEKITSYETEMSLKRKIMMDERKILISKRKVEAVRLLSHIFGLIEVGVNEERKLEEDRLEKRREEVKKLEQESLKLEQKRDKMSKISQEETYLREKIVSAMLSKEQRKEEIEFERLSRRV